MADQPQAQPQNFAPLAVSLQYLKDMSFESPRAPQVFVTQGPQSQVNVNVRVDGRGVGENTYEITLHLEVKAEAGGEAVFLLEMDYAGIFTVAPQAPEVLGPLLMIEAPRILFPFARQIVTATIAAGGFPPLLINPIDFADLYRRQLAAAGSAGSTGPTGTA
ncbi:MAG: protein-export chaperone SecB [Alphaproteobacteria bacterium]|nr:protein-export chaperone SecB [Alphaproteobacteria bacterium]